MDSATTVVNMSEQGKPTARKREQVVAVRLPEQVAQELKREARRRRTTLSEVLRERLIA